MADQVPDETRHNWRHITWDKLKWSNVWSTEFHLRRQKFVLFLIASILCISSEVLSTIALVKYHRAAHYVEAFIPGSRVDYRKIIAAASINIFIGSLVGGTFLTAVFCDLFWPQRREGRWRATTWFLASASAAILSLLAAIAFSTFFQHYGVKVLGDTSGYNVNEILMKGGVNPLYRRNKLLIASLACLWFGVIFTIASTILLWASLEYYKNNGTRRSEAARFNQQASAYDGTDDDRDHSHTRGRSSTPGAGVELSNFSNLSNLSNLSNASNLSDAHKQPTSTVAQAV